MSKVVIVWPEDVNPYELDFIKELTCASNDFAEIEIVKEPPKDENIRCIYVVNYWCKTHQPYGIYNKDYGLIYLADEEITRQMDMYINDPKCKFIWRQYVNPHYHGHPKVSYMPCAYQKGFSTIKLSNIKKDLLWSFAGAKHVNRVTGINTMSNAKPNYIHMTPEFSFNHSSGLNLEEYRKVCERSYYVLCPSGKFSMECSRLYECLEAGSIPITVKNSQQFTAEPSYHHFIFPPEDEVGPIPFIIGNTWDDCLQFVLANPEPVELTQKCIIYWKKCKAYWNKKLHIHANTLLDKVYDTVIVQHNIKSIVEKYPIINGWEKLTELVPNPQYLWDYGAKVYSQNKEDGILYRIFAEIGVTNKKILEIGAGDGIECMAANLILNHGFHGVLIDGSEYWLQIGANKYNEMNPQLLEKTTFNLAFVTRENILDVLHNVNGFGDFDMLSLDIDGIDYYILKTIMDSNKVNPRVIVVEYQDILGPVDTLTVSYKADFNHRDYDCYNGPNYCGASIGAFIYLLKTNYAFVGCDDSGFNGFFVRRDLLTTNLYEMTDISPCFKIPKVVKGIIERRPRTAHMEWVDVKTL